MNDFRKLLIEDVCKFVGGAQPPKEVFIDEERENYIRLIQTRDYKTDAYKTYIPISLARKFCNKSDIMIGRYGPPIFQICRGLEGAYNVALLKAVPKKNILNEYLYYFLSQVTIFKYVDLLSKRTGGQTGVDLVSLNKYPIDLPPLKLQASIAKVLSDLDANIELNNRINRELEAMAKTLYDYWFVQFDFPNENGKPYKSSGGKMVYNAELKREIPEGWKVGCIGDYCPSTGGFAFKSSWWTNKGATVVKIKDIQEDYTIDISNLAKVDLTDKKIDEKFKAKPGDILIAMTGATVGKYGIVPITDYQIYVNQRVGYFNLGKEPTEKLPYLINSLNQPYFREMIFSLASGAAQPNISNEQINRISLVIPVRTIINKYNLKFAPFYKSILNNQSQNQHLSELRDWLLPMLMNGQVTVKGTEEKLSMAAEPGVEYKKSRT